jgi:hypothetical protein
LCKHTKVKWFQKNISQNNDFYRYS